MIHVKDQGGFPGDKAPTYIGVGYYVLEAAAVVAAVMLLTRSFRSGWLLSIGVALGPLVGYVLSRGPGMPLYGDDRGNWTETLGVVSLVVEGALLILATVQFFRARSQSATEPYSSPAGVRSVRHDQRAVSAAR